MAFDWDSIDGGEKSPSKATGFDWGAVEGEQEVFGTEKKPYTKGQYETGFLESLATFMSAPQYLKQLTDVGLFKSPEEYINAMSKSKAEAEKKAEYGITDAPEPTNLIDRVARTAGALTLPTAVINPALGASTAGAIGAGVATATLPVAVGTGAVLTEGGGELASNQFGEEARPYGQLAGGILSAFPQTALQKGIEKTIQAKKSLDIKAGSVEPVFKDMATTSGVKPLSTTIDELDETFKATSPELAASPYMLVKENPVLRDAVATLSRSGLRQYGISGAKVQGEALSSLEVTKQRLATGAKAKLGIDPNAEEKAYALSRQLGTPEGELKFFSESPIVQRANVAIDKANEQLDSLGFNVKTFGNTSDTGRSVKLSVEDAIETKRKALNAQYTPLFDEADVSGVKFTESQSQQLLDSFTALKDSQLFSSFPSLWSKAESVLSPKVVGRVVKELPTPLGKKEVVVNSGVRQYPELRLRDVHDLKQELGKIAYGNSDQAGAARQLYKTVSQTIDTLPDTATLKLYKDLNKQFSDTVYSALDLKTVKAMSQDVWDSTVSGYLAKPQTIQDMVKATELVGGDTAQTMKLVEEALTARLAKSVVDIDGNVNKAKFNTFFEQHKEALSLPETKAIREKLLSYRDNVIQLTDDIASQESARRYVRDEIANSALVRMSGKGLQDTASRMRTDTRFFDDTVSFLDNLPEKSKDTMYQAFRGNYFDELVKNGDDVEGFLSKAPYNRQYEILFGKDNLKYITGVAKATKEIDHNLSVLREMKQPLAKSLSDGLDKQTGVSLSSLGAWMANQVQSTKYVVMNMARRTVLYRQDQARLKKLYTLLGDVKQFNRLIKEAEQGGKELSSLDKMVQYVQDKGLARTALDATGKAVVGTAKGIANMTPNAALRGGVTSQFATEPQTRAEAKGMFSQ